jgi:hypothetical protein
MDKQTQNNAETADSQELAQKVSRVATLMQQNDQSITLPSGGIVNLALRRDWIVVSFPPSGQGPRLTINVADPVNSSEFLTLEDGATEYEAATVDSAALQQKVSEAIDAIDTVIEASTTAGITDIQKSTTDSTDALQLLDL